MGLYLLKKLTDAEKREAREYIKSCFSKEGEKQYIDIIKTISKD